MDELSAVIGADRVNLTFFFGPRYLAPIRYLVLFFRTIIVLWKRKPEVVYAQNPAVFCPLTCLIYCTLRKKKLIIDHHAVWSTKTLTRGLLGKAIKSLEKFASSRAFANTTAHATWTKDLIKMGAKRVLTIYDFVETANRARDEGLRSKYSSGRRFIVLAPHGGHPLERLESEVQAAKSLESSSVMLLFSGPMGKLWRRIGSMILPENVRYIGFLELDEYRNLEASIDIGMSITDEPFTLSHSLLEFAANKIPVVSSKQTVVQELFGDSVLYVGSSDPARIAASLQRLISDQILRQEYIRRITEKQDELRLKRKTAEKELRDLILS